MRRPCSSTPPTPRTTRRTTTTTASPTRPSSLTRRSYCNERCAWPPPPCATLRSWPLPSAVCGRAGWQCRACCASNSPARARWPSASQTASSSGCCGWWCPLPPPRYRKSFGTGCRRSSPPPPRAACYSWHGTCRRSSRPSSRRCGEGSSSRAGCWPTSMIPGTSPSWASPWSPTTATSTRPSATPWLRSASTSSGRTASACPSR
mmetsp:Transcript_10242/g.33787  ORF Transcript_10242/g.33787 Transcript_10242/m.33787 type:complete len:205 (+) Transcript_10242:2527-3141(+)